MCWDCPAYGFCINVCRKGTKNNPNNQTKAEKFSITPEQDEAWKKMRQEAEAEMQQPKFSVNAKRDDSGYLVFENDKEREAFIEGTYAVGKTYNYVDKDGVSRSMKIHKAINDEKDLKSVSIDKPGITKEDAKARFASNRFGTNKNTGEKVEIFNSVFGKNHREGGLFEKIAPYIKDIYEDSELIYSEPDNLGGHKREDGSTHKAHNYVFSNYLGVAELNGNRYYVRLTLQRQKNRTGLHSSFITNVGVYKNLTKAVSGLPLTQEGKTDFDKISDAKL